MQTGRPSDYSPDILPTVAELALAGATDQEIADSIGVDRSTYYRWRIRYPEFRDAIKEGKPEADRKVIDSLYTKALAGDTTAQIFWLKNRQSKDWKDRKEITGEDGGPVQFTVRSILEEESK